MRTQEEVNVEYTGFCTQYGDALSKLKHLQGHIAKLELKLSELMAEGDAITAAKANEAAGAQ